MSRSHQTRTPNKNRRTGGKASQPTSSSAESLALLNAAPQDFQFPSDSLSPDDVVHLQRTIGNRATTTLVRSQRSPTVPMIQRKEGDDITLHDGDDKGKVVKWETLPEYVFIKPAGEGDLWERVSRDKVRNGDQVYTKPVILSVDELPLPSAKKDDPPKEAPKISPPVKDSPSAKKESSKKKESKKPPSKKLAKAKRRLGRVQGVMDADAHDRAMMLARIFNSTFVKVFGSNYDAFYFVQLWLKGGEIGTLKAEFQKIFGKSLEAAIRELFGGGDIDSYSGTFKTQYLLDLVKNDGRPSLYANLLVALRKVDWGFRGEATREAVMDLLEKATPEQWVAQKDAIQEKLGKDLKSMDVAKSVTALGSYHEAKFLNEKMKKEGKSVDKDSETVAKVKYLEAMIEENRSFANNLKRDTMRPRMDSWRATATPEERQAGQKHLGKQLDKSLKKKDRQWYPVVMFGGDISLGKGLLPPDMEGTDEEKQLAQQSVADMVALLNAMLKSKKRKRFRTEISTLGPSKVHQYLGSFLTEDGDRKLWMDSKTPAEEHDRLFKKIIRPKLEAALLEAGTGKSDTERILFNLEQEALSQGNLKKKSNYEKLEKFADFPYETLTVVAMMMKRLIKLSPPELLALRQNQSLLKRLEEICKEECRMWERPESLWDEMIVPLIGGTEPVIEKGSKLSKEEALQKTVEDLESNPAYWALRLGFELNNKNDKATIATLIQQAQSSALERAKRNSDKDSTPAQEQAQTFMKAVYKALDKEDQRHLRKKVPQIHDSLSKGEWVEVDSILQAFKGRILVKKWAINVDKTGILNTIKQTQDDDFVHEWTNFEDFQECVKTRDSLQLRKNENKLTKEEEARLVSHNKAISEYIPQIRADRYLFIRKRLDPKDMQSVNEAMAEKLKSIMESNKLIRDAMEKAGVKSTHEVTVSRIKTRLQGEKVKYGQSGTQYQILNPHALFRDDAFTSLLGLNRETLARFSSAKSPEEKAAASKEMVALMSSLQERLDKHIEKAEAVKGVIDDIIMITTQILIAVAISAATWGVVPAWAFPLIYLGSSLLNMGIKKMLKGDRYGEMEAINEAMLAIVQAGAGEAATFAYGATEIAKTLETATDLGSKIEGRTTRVAIEMALGVVTTQAFKHLTSVDTRREKFENKLVKEVEGVALQFILQALLREPMWHGVGGAMPQSTLPSDASVNEKFNDEARGNKMILLPLIDPQNPVLGYFLSKFRTKWDKALLEKQQYKGGEVTKTPEKEVATDQSPPSQPSLELVKQLVDELIDEEVRKKSGKLDEELEERLRKLKEHTVTDEDLEERLRKLKEPSGKGEVPTSPTKATTKKTAIAVEVPLPEPRKTKKNVSSEKPKPSRESVRSEVEKLLAQYTVDSEEAAVQFITALALDENLQFDRLEALYQILRERWQAYSQEGKKDKAFSHMHLFDVCWCELHGQGWEQESNQRFTDDLKRRLGALKGDTGEKSVSEESFDLDLPSVPEQPTQKPTSVVTDEALGKRLATLKSTGSDPSVKSSSSEESLDLDLPSVLEKSTQKPTSVATDEELAKRLATLKSTGPEPSVKSSSSEELSDEQLRKVLPDVPKLSPGDHSDMTEEQVKALLSTSPDVPKSSLGDHSTVPEEQVEQMLSTLPTVKGSTDQPSTATDEELANRVLELQLPKAITSPLPGVSAPSKSTSGSSDQELRHRLFALHGLDLTPPSQQKLNTAYRLDMATGGAWGSEAEAGPIAEALKQEGKAVKIRIFRMVKGKPHLYDEAGTGPNVDLLFTGGHYKMLGWSDGIPYVQDVAGDGSCFFNAVFEAVFKQLPTKEDIQKYRALVSVGLTDEQITTITDDLIGSIDNGEPLPPGLGTNLMLLLNEYRLKVQLAQLQEALFLEQLLTGPKEGTSSTGGKEKEKVSLTSGLSGLSMTKTSDKSTGPTSQPTLQGIRNLGNTCYLNSALNTLAFSEPYYQAFLSASKADDATEEVLLVAQLLQDIRAGNPKIKSLQQLVRKLKLDHEQRDVDEALFGKVDDRNRRIGEGLIDLLPPQLKQQVGLYTRNITDFGKDLSKHTPVSGKKAEAYVQIGKDGKTQYDDPTPQALYTLYIASGQSFQQAINHEFGEQQIGDAKYASGSQVLSGPAKQSRQVRGNPPQAITFRLISGGYHLGQQQYQPIPSNFNLSNWLQIGGVLYRLKVVVYKHGGKGGGHYTTDTFDPKEGWRHRDDSHVGNPTDRRGAVEGAYLCTFEQVPSSVNVNPSEIVHIPWG